MAKQENETREQLAAKLTALRDDFRAFNAAADNERVRRCIARRGAAIDALSGVEHTGEYGARKDVGFTRDAAGKAVHGRPADLVMK